MRPIPNPLVKQDGVEHHAVLCAKHRNCGFGVAGKYRPPACTTGDSRHQPALGRLVVDKHQQSCLFLPLKSRRASGEPCR